jgi:hypothetical protein
MSFESQDRAIENLLRSKYGEWLPCYELADLALQYCRAINTIRKRLRRAGDRERIENKKEHVRGQVHGFYRIAPTADVLSIAPAKPQPSPKAIPDSPDWFEREFGARPTPRVATSDLPLFAGSSL